MLKRIALFGLVFALLVLVSCAKAPEQEIQNANTAIETARASEAEDYAPDAFAIAMDTLTAAMAAKEEADGKFALFRSYSKSKELFIRAEALANEAQVTAQTEKERVRMEAEGLLTPAKALLDSADVALKKAPKGKGTKAEIELITQDLNATKAEYDGAKLDYDAGKYKAAKTKLEAVMQKTRSIMDEISKARAMKK
jgi:hypothetical protein